MDTVARARAGDPVTSFEAADKVEKTGKARRDREACLRVVLAEPGRTAAEIAKIAGIDRYDANRRLPELRDAGRVVNREKRVCRVLGSRVMTWYPKSGQRTFGGGG